MLRKKQKRLKKIKHIANEFESTFNIGETNLDKKIFDTQPNKSNLIFLQEIDASKNDEEILEKARALLILLEQYIFCFLYLLIFSRT
ncbi:MAG: hypothetical protein MTP17_03240 [Candidatus Midichloria sp.]|nr:MAG: hypothetical protein MTP17_03240 [Candidatus Midichloria sp.]